MNALTQTSIAGGQEQNTTITDKIYIINRHFWAEDNPRQVVAMTANTQAEADKILSEYRQENKKNLNEARKKGDKALEEVYFNTTFSISISFKHNNL